MKCLTENENCIIKKQTLLGITNLDQKYQIIIINNQQDLYCSVQCKNENIKILLKNDIDNNLYIEKNIEECLLCTNKFYHLIELTCNHKICNECLKKFYDNSTKCPICRTLIILNSEDNNNNLNNDHVYLLDTIYKLITSINYHFDKDLLYSYYSNKTNRNLYNDLIIIKEYINMF